MKTGLACGKHVVMPIQHAIDYYIVNFLDPQKPFAMVARNVSLSNTKFAKLKIFISTFRLQFRCIDLRCPLSHWDNAERKGLKKCNTTDFK